MSKATWVGRVHLIHASPLLFITTGTQGRKSNLSGTSFKELMQIPWRNAAYWLALHGLLNLLSYKTQDH